MSWEKWIVLFHIKAIRHVLLITIYLDLIVGEIVLSCCVDLPPTLIQVIKLDRTNVQVRTLHRFYKINPTIIKPNIKLSNPFNCSTWPHRTEPTPWRLQYLVGQFVHRHCAKSCMQFRSLLNVVCEIWCQWVMGPFTLWNMRHLDFFTSHLSSKCLVRFWHKRFKYLGLSTS